LFYQCASGAPVGPRAREQCLRWASSAKDPALLLEAHRPLGVTLFCLGEVASARGPPRGGLPSTIPSRHRSHAFLYSIHPGMACCSYLAWALWLQGYGGSAYRGARRRLPRPKRHPLSLAQALSWAAWLHHLRPRAPKAAQECASGRWPCLASRGFRISWPGGRCCRAGASGTGQGIAGIAGCGGAGRSPGHRGEEHRPFFLAARPPKHAQHGGRLKRD